MKNSNRLLRLLPDLVLVLMAAVVLFPVFYGLMGAFKTPQEFSSYPPTLFPESFRNLDNFRYVFDMTPMLRYYLNSLIVATLSSTVRMFLAVFAAYAFVFYRFPGHRFFFLLMLTTMMLPPDVLVIANYQTVSGMGLLDTYLGMCIVSFVGASQMFMLRQQFMTSPVALHDAAMLDGCGDFRFIFSVLLPTARPVLITLFLQSFLAQWNTYLWPLLVTNRNSMRTVQVGITMLTTIDATNYEVILAATFVTMLPTMVVYLILRKAVSHAMSSGALIS